MDNQMIKAGKVDFEALVRRDNKLTLNFQSKLLSKMHEIFTEEEEQWYVANLYIHINRDRLITYPINLESVYGMIGFAHKKNAKRTLENNFMEGRDYKIFLEAAVVSGEAASSSKKNGGAGLNKETIMLTVEAFKALCMMAKTKKGPEIRAYYIKLETIMNALVDEERIENEKLLLQKDIETQKLIEMKNLEIEAVKAKLKNQQPISMLYIGHNPVIEHLHKIGITDDALIRQESHRSSNPQFKYLFTIETEHASKIEFIVKLLLKPFKVVKPEWYSVTYHQIKKVVDFGIMMYENYAIHDNVENLIEFVSRYRSNRLINTNKARVFLDKDIYTQYVNECVTIGPGLRVPTHMICSDFHKWYCKKFPGGENVHMKLETGNWSKFFQSELTKNISSVTGLEYLESSASGVSMHDKKRGIFFSKSSGFKGMELKSMEKQTGYFDISVYEQYVKEFITVTNNHRHKVARIELVDDFTTWIKNQNVVCKTPIFQKSRISNTFKEVLIETISKITGIELQQVCKHTYRGCFVGMSHSKFLFLGNVSPEKRKEPEMDLIKKQIDTWLVDVSKIADFFRMLKSSQNNKVDIRIVRELMKNSNLTSNKKNKKISLIFARDKKHYFFTDGAQEYINTLE